MRDAVVSLFSVVVILSQYPKLAEETVFYVTIFLAAVLLLLCLVDLVLVLTRKGRVAMVGIAAFQLAMGFLWAGLFLPIGAVLIVLNAALLVALREKTAEYILKHTPVPRTRNYRVATGVGTLVMLGALFMPWFSASRMTASLFSVDAAVVTRSGGLPALSIDPTAVIFALLALVGSPVAVSCGALALRWRRLSLISGVLGLAAGIGVIVVLAAAASFGAYVMAVGGVLLLAGFFGLRGASRPGP